MDTIKAFIKPDEEIVKIICPHCRKITELPLNKLNKKYRSKIKCYCQAVFAIEIESRDQFRKKVNLPGFYDITNANVSLEAKFVNRSTQDNRVAIPNCRIIELSRHGLSLEILDNAHVKAGDILKFRFNLDNSAQTEIKQECEVCHVEGRHVGCKMLKDNVSIGFYLID